MKNSASKTPNKSWEKTKVQNLVRHKSGRYYARTFGNNKEIWKSLRTDHLSVAKARLAEFLREQREKQSAMANHSSAKMTFGEALAIHLQNQADGVTIKPTTRHYWKQVFTSLLKSWPGLAERAGSRKPIARSGRAGFARSHPQRATTTRLLAFDMCSMWQLRRASFTAIRRPSWSACRCVRSNSRSRVGPSSSNLSKRLSALVRGARAIAPIFLRGLAFTGCRKGEAGEMRWRDLDFAAGEIVVRGDSETGTKNWTVRRVPMIPDAGALFQRMLETSAGEPLTAKVFRVNEAQKAIDGATRKLGLARITHHDLRHLFATPAIESGVDIPKVSRWLGHKDGGAWL